MTMQIDITDSELMEAARVQAELEAKYSRRPWTMANAQSLASEAKERFASIGLEVTVDLISPTPTIEVVGRTKPFDIERQFHDVQTGVAQEWWDAKYPKQPGKPDAPKPDGDGGGSGLIVP